MISKKTVLGVYSDSTLNNLELSLIETDGVDLFGTPVSLLRPYPSDLKNDIYNLILKGDFSDTLKLKELSERLTLFHIEVIKEFILIHKRNHPQIDLIGYSGHTVYQNPDEKINITLGNSQTIANQFKIAVVSRFLHSDLIAGGKGGPLFASFYDAMTRNMQKPVGILSIGGILNMTAIGPYGNMESFDCSIGTVLLDHWIYKKTGQEMDYNGKYAKFGTIDKALLNRLLKEKYLLKQPPKTIRRESFMEYYKHVEGSSIENGAATLTAFIAHSFKNAIHFLKTKPTHWILTGGGIYNPTLVQMIKKVFFEPCETALDLNWQNDTLNAQGYAFLSVRSLTGLPITFPTTSGVKEAITGGHLFMPENLE